MAEKVWLKPPRGQAGEPAEVEPTPEILTPLMVKGWSQCQPPVAKANEPKETDHAS